MASEESPDAVTYINCFEVPAGREEAFLALWTEVNAYMRTKPGFISHRLHRATQPDARYRFINIPQWESAKAFADAHDDGFRKLVQQPAWREFTSTGQLVEVVDEGHVQRCVEAAPSWASRQGHQVRQGSWGMIRRVIACR